MRIAVDARPLSHPGSRDARYVAGMFDNLVSRLPDAEWILLSHKAIAPEFAALLTSGRVEIRVESSFVPQLPAIWMQRSLPRMIEKAQADIFWGTTGLLPRNIKKKLPGIKTILNVNDVSFRTAPEELKFIPRLEQKYFLEESLQNADSVLCQSQSFRDELIQLYPSIPQDKIKVIYPGMNPPAKKVSHPLDLPFFSEHFYLSVGTIEKRKNYKVLMEAYRRARRENPYLYPLVIAGKNGNEIKDELAELIQGAYKPEGIYYIETPTDGQLTWLYESCRVAFFPSLHESFPLRVLESLMHGKPAVLSDIPIMREIHPHGRFASPTDVEAWKTFLLQMHGKELPKQATFQSKKWQWDKRSDELAREFKGINKASRSEPSTSSD
ncbi:MAG: glycosyltransferase family 1 protein [Leptospiraceae bacterium]